MKDYILKKLEDGKTITVKDVHKVILPIAEEIDRICQKYSIEYGLAGGSALGAVRHQGFIPWDDDFDILMMAQDFPRFIEALQSDLDEAYHFQCFKTHKEYNVLIPAMKIRKKNTYIEEANSLLKNKCKDGDGVFVDVLLMDYCSKSKWVDLPFRVFNQALMPCIAFLENLKLNPILLKRLFINTANFYGRINKNSDYIGYDLTWTFKNPFHPYIYKKEVIFPCVRMPFETLNLPVANNYDQFLITEIGKTYMQFPPLDKQKPKHIVDIDLGE